LHKRLSILAGFVALLCAGLPTSVYAQGSAQAFESKLEGWRRNFNVWLHQRSPEQPFRYYGFFEATEKYFRTRILGQEPEDADVTRIVNTIDRSNERLGPEQEIARLEARIASAPLEIAEREQHIEEMKQERDMLRAQLGAAQQRFESSKFRVGSPNAAENSQAWDDRTRLKSALASMQNRLGQIDGEIARAEMARIRLMQTHELRGQIEVKKTLLASIEDSTTSTDYYLVPYRPPLLATLGAIAALLALTGVALRKKFAALPTAVAMGLTALLAGLLYVLLRILSSEQQIPAVSVFANPGAFSVGFAVLLGTRIALTRRVRGSLLLPSIQFSLAAVLACGVAMLVTRTLVGPSSGFSLAIVLALLRDLAWFGAWGLATLWILDWNQDLVAKFLAISGVTLACAIVGSLPAGIGVAEAGRSFGTALVVGASLLAVETARGTPAPEAEPEDAPPSPDESRDPLMHLARW
jgi:hypothetical protein